MREEDILEELHELDGKLKSLPPQTHWLCPRRFEDDMVDYDQPDQADEDMTLEEKRKHIRDGRERHEMAYKYSLVYGLGQDLVGDLQNAYQMKLNGFLATCDKCAYNWHEGRKAFLKDLSEKFEEEVVRDMAERLSSIDFVRLNKGLKGAEETLNQVDPLKRTQSYLATHNQTGLLALYESLCCVEYHRNDQILAGSFDFVFEQLQSRRILRMADLLPAMARFLFSRNPIRNRFSIAAWEKTESKLTGKTFDWAVHDVLTEAIMLVAQPCADPDDITIFWKGFLRILAKMDKDLITHRLLAMEVQPGIFRLALQHFSANSGTIVQLVLDALQILLEKAPRALWSSLGSISASTVADQVFQSKGFMKLLANPDNFEKDDPKRSQVVSWIPGFLKSISSDQQYEACRTLLSHLLGLVQRAPECAEAAKNACLFAGLDALYLTLIPFNSSEYRVNASTSLIVISEVMGLVNQYKHIITGCADLGEDSENVSKLKGLALLVIKEALALDCKSINIECEELRRDIPIQRGLRGHSQSIWQAVLDIFRPGNVELAKSIIPATFQLVGLDKFLPRDKKKPNEMPANQLQFNKDVGQLMDNVSRIIDRLSDFPSMDLGQFSQDPKMSRPLFASLISSDENVCQATVGVIKAMTGEDTRQDAVQNLFETSFGQMLSALIFAANKVINTKAFGPVPNMVKFNREALQALAGDTGVIRARSGFSKEDKKAIMLWWTGQWRVLDMIFSNLEKWAPRVDKNTQGMLDFTRDVAEFAGELFGKYNVFASSQQSTSPTSSEDEGDLETYISSKDAIKKVLQVTCNNLDGMTTWLRLRDGYMIGVIASFLGKLLGVLGDYNLEVDDRTAKFIKSALDGSTRTNMTSQQKADLQRALDDHQGLEIIDEPKNVSIFKKKQATIDSWTASAEGKQHEPRLPPKTETKSTTTFTGKSDKYASLVKHKAETVMSEAAREAFKSNRRKLEEEKAKTKAEAIAKARALRAPAAIRGEGSGLNGLGGVAGKDHAPIRSEIMVSSDEEDDDEDDEDETNALVKKRKETNKTVAEYEESKRRARLLMNSGPVKKTKVQRSAKDLRARVEPNMDRLYLEILGWDIFHDGDSPPSNNECRKIDNKYLDLDLYKSTFGPLLISEVWRSLVTARDENNYKPIEIKVLNRLSVDKFMEVSTNMPRSTSRDLQVSERDIVLLSQSPDPLNSQGQPHCLARVERTTRKKDVLEVTYRISRDTKPALLQCLVPNGKLYILKIADMTTTQREYAALSSLEYYDLCSEILEAKPSPLQKYTDEKVSSVSARYNLNTGQAKAILSANDNDGFTLIQGPPGSGKTKTIVAMVGSLLTQTLQQQAQEQAQQKPAAPGQKAASTAAPKKKLLICAPSNAAVDELVVRLKEGILPLSGSRQKINVIRLGRSDAINTAVKDVMLDELVQKKLDGNSGEKDKINADREKLHTDAAQIKEKLNVIRPQMDKARTDNDVIEERKLRQQFDQLKRQQAMIGSKIDEDKQSGNTYARQNEINRQRFQQEIIDGAHVLCSTLSGSGHDMLRKLNVEFETVIIDEAAQCIELSALIPLKYGCSKCILVGDPEQLPPTVLSRSAQSFGYEQSLFVRMQKNHPKDVHLLDTQYRMHPEISSFPSEQFYNSRLIDGPDMAKLRQQPWHASTILGPYRFFDVAGTQTKQVHGHSFINIPELNAALQLYSRLKTDYTNVDFKGKIGIITTYKAQLNEMKLRFAHTYGEEIFQEIEFNTTDAFQGREREIIIFSCVRAKATGGIGFLGDIRRMNVGLTRAKSSLWVLGDSRSLKQGQFWNRLIEDAKSRDRYTTGDIVALFSKPTARGGQPAMKAKPAPANGTAPSPALSQGASAPSNNIAGPAPPQEVDDSEDDVGMTDAACIPNSRKPSVVASPPVANASRGQNLLGDQSKPGHKRSRDPEDQGESGPGKKALPNPPTGQMSSIELALQAQQAAKAKSAGARPRPPGGVAPPRRPRPAADPFIARKPAKRN
ncbi:uncharacterized protein L3040_000105 [Drepanopeziza brunnea f. sp. 'multigermtubi']|uniref:tRNA-splicing endonuclease n=1 Tax=Marssonina brunnea f. sp. multigermtubi (strain MB_m1) TaxID=1072389 RepID=K1X166_MARBU|nr:uncharacterized protein MBM_07304 [Drepanopeziza brunnea f. sp. 'multigermtubi' MB_m1]EKD14583.1 hypothetical protein MBM_07304 [Drepanopeziza brunnea f. sp. 'multigermtubi' MB_m1]KAJ5053814.1 hypothetical protein L3040_000105 [Drepanopeziza brunnea f. sp. 'multigermtubi']